MEGVEEKSSNISEYKIPRIKYKILSLKHSYGLVIFFLGFVNDASKTWTEFYDKAATYLYSNFRGWEYPKSGRTIHNWNQEFRKEELFMWDKQKEKIKTSTITSW